MSSQKNFLSTTQVARLLGISREAVLKRINKGQLKATKVGRNYIVSAIVVGKTSDKGLSKFESKQIDLAVDKTVREYGDTLRMLGGS